MITYTGTLLNLDGVVDAQGDIFDENTIVELPSRHVPVTFNFHDGPEFVLGRAKLFFRPGKLCYKIELTDERLPKYALETLIPCAGGRAKARNGKNVSHVSIETVGMAEYRNSDVRIKSLKEQK